MKLKLFILISAVLLAGIAPATNPPHPPLSKGGEGGFKEGTLLVGFKKGAISPERIHGKAGASIKRKFGFIGVHQVVLPPGLSVEEAAALYMENPDVEFAEPDYRIWAAGLSPDDPRFAEQWGLFKISAPDAWVLHRDSGDAIVAVIDSGVDYNHEDLAANIWANTAETAGNSVDDDGNGYVDDVRGWDFANGDNDPMDDSPTRHGTHVAGIVGASGDNGKGVSGVNWSVKIMPLKVLDSTGGGYVSDEIAAIDYAVRHGAKVINASFTYNCVGQPLPCPLQAEKAAIKAAGDAGVLYVTAAGNYGCNNDITPFYPAGHDLPNIISVSASNSSDSLASFSNYGKSSVHLAAPGVGILSTAMGYQSQDGTSMSAPFVSGVLALLQSYKGITGIQARELIFATADYMGHATITGGRLNAYRALSAELSSVAPVPPSGLSASAGGSVSLSWRDNSSVEEGFIIERRTSDGAYEEIASAGSTSYTDGGANQGSTYYYRIKAYNSAGPSAASNEASVVMQAAAPVSPSTAPAEASTPKTSTSGCFIATAAYGSPLAPEVEALRLFRDKYLITNPAGRAFVGLYYRLSPPIARCVSERPALRPVVRAALKPVLFAIEHPIAAFVFFAPPAAWPPLALYLSVRRRKRRNES